MTVAGIIIIGFGKKIKTILPFFRAPFFSENKWRVGMSRRYKIISDAQNVHGNARTRPSRAEVEPLKIYWWCMGRVRAAGLAALWGIPHPELALRAQRSPVTDSHSLYPIVNVTVLCLSDDCQRDYYALKPRTLSQL